MSGVGLAGLLNGLVSHAQALGQFVQVLDYEPSAAPHPQGITLALWADPIDPQPQGSGLRSTSVRVIVAGRLYRSMFAEPRSDTVILGALDALFAAYSADFTLGGLVESIDLLGRRGVALAATPGYVNPDNKLFRSIDITIPLLVSDAWDQVP